MENEVKASMRTVRRPAVDAPVIAEVDVAVYGGGPAGVCAAIGAARAGRSVLLVERSAFLGGTATGALVNIFHPLTSMDGSQQIIAGACREFLQRLLDLGAARIQPAGPRGNWIVETEYAKFVLDAMVAEAGVRVLFHGLFSGCAGSKERVEAGFVETRGGVRAVVAKIHVDCTGDADLVAAAGLPYVLERGHLQSPSLCIRLGGVDVDAFQAWGKDVERDRTGITAILRRRGAEKGWGYPNYLWGNFNNRRKGEAMFAAIRIPNTDATDPWDLSHAESEARKQALWMLGVLREEVPGFADATFIDIGSWLGLRETRRILGAHLLRGDDLLAGARYPDGIAQGTYPVDIHSATGGGITFHRLDGTQHEIDAEGKSRTGYWTPDGKPRPTPFWQVPYGCLYFRESANVLVAGRPISVDKRAFGATRVMVNCMQFGHAAGVAAALAARARQPDVRIVPPVELRGELSRQGAIIL